MFVHYIITSSSYSKGKRIALHYLIETETWLTKCKDIVKKITFECGKDVSISTHVIRSYGNTWDSVVENDAFFKNVELISSLDLFIELINKDRTLLGIDVAKYILNKIKCTHLKLQKLVYLCYADYLCNNDDLLFNDDILTFIYGPVIESVYNQYKGQKNIEQGVDDNEILSSKVEEMPTKSRILFAENGNLKISNIDNTLEKYKNYTASQLVDLTHKENSPWDIANKQGLKKITSDLILEFHKNEI